MEETFDNSVYKITNIIGEDKVTISDIDFVIKQTEKSFDIEIPEINTVHTYMLGHDCHSIAAGARYAEGLKRRTDQNRLSRKFEK